MIKTKLIILIIALPIMTMAQIVDTTAVKSIEGITNKMLKLISVEIDEAVD